MHEKLFAHFDENGLLKGLHPMQVEKFRYACEKAVVENPDLGFNNLIIACRVYLNLIYDLPEIDLGGIRPQI